MSTIPDIKADEKRSDERTSEAHDLATGLSTGLGPVRLKGRKGRKPGTVEAASGCPGTPHGGLSFGNSTVATARAKLGRPRWFNQSFLVFMALRQAGTPLPRGELIRRALELDKKIGLERGLPPCFTGKVRMPDASPSTPGDV